MTHPLIPTRWQVPEVFRQRLGEKPGRQRLMQADGHLLLVLHKLPEPGAEERTAHLFWHNPAGEWQSSDGGAGIADLLEHIHSYDRAADALEARLRNNPSAENYFAVLSELAPLLRATRHMAAVLQETRDAAKADRNILLARDEVIETERQLDLMHSEANHGMQYLLAARAEEQARQNERLVAASHRLNLLMAVTLPATAIASIFGTNLRHGLENRGLEVFWMFLAGAVVLGLFAMLLVSAPVRRGK